MKANKTKSGNYRVQLSAGYDANGKRIIKSFTAPEAWQAIKMAEDYKKGLVVEPKKMTVRDAFEYYIASRNNILSPSTIKGYNTIKNSRLQAIRNFQIDSLKISDVQMAVNIDAQTLSRKSIKSAVALLKSALSLQEININIDKITLPAQRPNKKDIPPVEKVLNVIIGSDIEIPCLLAMWLSLRISEVRGLKFKDISDDGKYISIRRTKLALNNGDVVREINKTEESTRTNLLPQYLYKKIIILPHSSSEDFIVNINYSSLRSRFKNLMSKNGLDITFHSLRHEFATTLNDLGIPSEYIQKLGGWSTDNVMKSVYTHTTKSKEETYQQNINDFFMALIEKNEKVDNDLLKKVTVKSDS